MKPAQDAIDFCALAFQVIRLIEQEWQSFQQGAKIGVGQSVGRDISGLPREPISLP